jgi:hypothetical protein
MGSGPITHEEMRAWQQNAGIDLAPWECRLLRRLSEQYLAEAHKAEKEGAPPPWQPPEVEVKPAVTSQQAALRALANL